MNGLDTDTDTVMNMNMDMDMDMHNGDTDGCTFKATYIEKNTFFFKGAWRLSVWSSYGHGYGYGYLPTYLAVP
jgi:hypothetical protein